jgi:formate hydrogenlyase transcriptional activator
MQYSGYQNMMDSHFPIYDGFIDTILSATHPLVFDIDEVNTWPESPAYMATIKTASLAESISTALRNGDEPIGVLTLWTENKHSFTAYHKKLMQRIADQISTVVINISANEKIIKQLEEINRYKEQLEEEKLYLQEQIETKYNYGEIIGAGEEMQKVFHLLSQVAFANSTVLLLGETGTGKELIARAIHNSSPRKDKLMVKVNCAALPANLTESELFGHEKGSFTGATERRIGKFELANKGTLFLDEIGEMPPDLQVKLLRAIQEKEIERVGGKTTIKIDVRIIAATNRNLEKEVEEGRFRSDLFYRLNVFPITLPPLRNRKEDIPVLATHFIERFARNIGKKKISISNKTMKELKAYHWPGNVRELEHLMERSVLLAKGNIIKEVHLPITPRNTTEPTTTGDIYMKTLEEHEREYILEVLEKCNGKVFGRGGAAEVLNVNVSTLNSRMKKLGIEKQKPTFKKMK